MNLQSVSSGKAHHLVGCSMMVLILLVVGAPWASAELPWWDDGTMAAVGSWQDPSGEGSDLQLEFSPDGSMLLMVGYGSPDEIRVADRDIQLVTTLSPPGLNATVKGARWSHQGTWVVAWGREEGGSRDYLRAWGTASFERSDSLFEDDMPPLEVVDSVLFPSNDAIIAIAGRDAYGTSRLLIMETHTKDVLTDITWEGNASLVTLETDNQNLICIDEAGALTAMSTRDWTVAEKYEGRTSRPSAWSFPRKGGYPWLAGYEDGSVYFWMNTPREPGGEAKLADGPVLGVAWFRNELEHYYLAALPEPGGGSEIKAYIYHEEGRPAVTVSDVVTVDSRVTMLARDPVNDFTVMACMEDGTLVMYRLDLLPDTPPEVVIDEPVEGARYSENFTARGKVTDERDNVSYVRVWVDEHPVVNATISGDGWTAQVDLRWLEAGDHVLHVEAFDGTQINTTQVGFKVEGGKDDGDPAPGPSGPLALAMMFLSVLALVLLRRRAR